MSPTSSRPRKPRAARVLAAGLAASALLLSGCGGAGEDGEQPQDEVMRLAGPDTNIIVTIPSGWHQVINSANPIIPEMVAPVKCIGSNEVSCALGLARIATTPAATVEEAAALVEQAVTSTPGVTKGNSVSQGPGKVGKRDGYRHRFMFSNPGATLTAEVAAVPSGPPGPDSQGKFEFSVILVWVSDKPGAPKPEVIDEIVGSALVAGGNKPQ